MFTEPYPDLRHVRRGVDPRGRRGDNEDAMALNARGRQRGPAAGPGAAG